MIVIIKKSVIMIITKQNPSGGPALKAYTIQEDPETGLYGYPIGYCPCGCKERLLIRTLDMREICNKFGWSLTEYEETQEEVKRRLAPRLPLRHRMIKWLGGSVEE